MASRALRATSRGGWRDERGATIVLTGSEAIGRSSSRRQGAASAGPRDRRAGGVDLPTLAALLERSSTSSITGDTGPMHLAAAVGTPIVAVFGPSDPRRYAPAGRYDRVVRVDLPCAPCNRIRLPPGAVHGHVPDCLALVPSDRVFDAAVAVTRPVRRPATVSSRDASA